MPGEDNQVTLRPARREDASTIRQMVNQARLFPFALAWQRFWLAVEESGEIVGCVQIKPHGDGTREMASLVVTPGQQGKGIARTLIQMVQANNPAPLYLTCRGALQPFYQKFGFQTLARADLPPYFGRLRRLFEILRFVLRFDEELAVMVWKGG